MDYKDYLSGACQSNFWFNGKLGLIKKLFETKLPKWYLDKDLQILNVGVGTGNDLALIGSYGNVYAVDIDQNALDLVLPSLVVEKRKADVCKLPYSDNFFDIVTAFDVLEHVKCDMLATREILRVLKPGGYFISTVPAFNFLFSQHDVFLQHYRRYNKENYSRLFSQFFTVTLGYWFFLGFLPAATIRLLSKKNKNEVSKNNGVNWHKIPLSGLCSKVLSCENWLISKGVKFPFGLTLYGIHQKKDKGA